MVKSFVYLEDRDKYAEMNKYYGEFFPDDPPARTTLGVAQVPGESRLEITCIAYSDLAERKAIGTPRAGFPYSPGILAGDTLYVSGKGDQLPGGGHPATFEEQVRQAMRNVETTLKQAGLDFRHVVMSHVFLDKYENLEVGQSRLQRVLRGRQRARLRHGVRRLDPRRFPRRGHLHRHHRPVGPQGRPACRHEAGAERGHRDGKSRRLGGKDALPLRGARPQADRRAPRPATSPSRSTRWPGTTSPILETAGLALEDIVSGCVYLRDMKDYQPMNAVYRPYFSRGHAVRTCLMPNSGIEKNAIRVQASFIAARTR